MLLKEVMTRRIIIPRSAETGYTYAVPLTQFSFPSKPYNGRLQIPIIQSLYYLCGVCCYAH